MKSNNLKKEEKRLNNLGIYERQLRKKGYKLICGIDEAGRGSLAGPVVAGAVILKENCKIYGLNDSKKLTSKKREKIFKEIKKNSLSWATAKIEAKIIDRINIHKASLLAMQKAVSKLKIKPDYLLIDGFSLPELNINQKGIKNGDSICASISAASILAKVSRDKIMLNLDKKYPQYGFVSNKGYGTKKHFQSIKEFGISPIHRMSFNLIKKN